MGRACEAGALLVLCKGVMGHGPCSSPLCFWGVPRELPRTAPALQHHTGARGAPTRAKPPTLEASSLCILLKGRTLGYKSEI